MFLLQCTPSAEEEITANELKTHIEYLASDQLQGRYPGTREDSLLQEYIAKEFESSGLISFHENYRQEFEFIAGISAAEDNYLIYSDQDFKQGKDYYPLSFSGNGEIIAKVEFCGYGFDFSTDDISRNDYVNSLPEGKWAMILQGEPTDHPEFSKRSRDRDKAMLAMEKGAAGVLLVSGEAYSPYDELDTSISHVPGIQIPVIQIKRNIADDILLSSGYTIKQLEARSKQGPLPFIESGKKLSSRIKVIKRFDTTANMVAYAEGTDPDLNEWILIGAHHDHLGMGGPGSSSRSPDTIAVHNGADDNASGVAAILELSEYFSSKRYMNTRNIAFISFGAEEMGLLGSKFFVENAPIEPENLVYMINIDMLGRMKKDSSLQVGGVGTSEIGKEFLDSLNNKYNFKLTLSEAGYGPSDHSSFYLIDIPVYFFSTGAHQDYHTPFDDADSLNYRGLEKGTQFIAELVMMIDTMKKRPEFKEAGPKTGNTRRYKNKITLGIMPDVSGESKGGMKVLAVTEGKPADVGGMKKGDIIIAVDGNKISNVYDYMYQLNNFKPGDPVVVSVKRDDSVIDLLIQL